MFAAVRKRGDTAVDNRMYEARSGDVRTFPPPNSLLLNVQTVTGSGLWFVFRQFLLFRRQVMVVDGFRVELLGFVGFDFLAMSGSLHAGI